MSTAVLAPSRLLLPALLAELRHRGLSAQPLLPPPQDHLMLLDVAPPLASPLVWAQTSWSKVQIEGVASIADAARRLSAVPDVRRWAMLRPPDGLHRRAALIQAQQARTRVWDSATERMAFPPPPTEASADPPRVGAWTLRGPNELVLLTHEHPRNRRFPLGIAEFAEDKSGPPARSYLKLWEAFTRLGHWPRRGDLCLDLGASPGGWTWALQQLGADVVAVDKAPLDAKISRQRRVHVLRRSAFSLDPGPAQLTELAEVVGRRDHPTTHIDWLVADIACYPARLLRLVQAWRSTGLVRHIVCTIKFQHQTDFAAIDHFHALSSEGGPGSTVLVHLYHNKHELTWMWSDGSAVQ